MYKVNSIHSAATDTGEDFQQEYSAQPGHHISLNMPSYCRKSRSEIKLPRDLENYLEVKLERLGFVYSG